MFACHIAAEEVYEDLLPQHIFINLYLFTHFPDTFIQSNLQVRHYYLSCFYFYQYFCYYYVSLNVIK